MTSWCGV